MNPLQIARLVLSAALIAWAAFWFAGYRQDMKELEGLREQAQAQKAKDEATAGAHEEYAEAKKDAAEQARAATEQRIIIEQRTIEVAREDQATADFLATPIPLRLRQADCEARSRGLAGGQRPCPGSEPAH